MSGWAAFKAFVTFLPEVLKFIKWLAEKLEEGYTEIEIRRSADKIFEAFNNPDRQAAARQLNDIFRK